MTLAVRFLKLKLALLLLLLTVAWSLPSHAAVRCEILFLSGETTAVNPAPKKPVKHQVKQFMNRFKPQRMSFKMVEALFNSVRTLVSDATGKRVESKVTAETEVVETAIARFKDKLEQENLSLVDRDKTTDGKRNVTYTEYTRPFSVTLRELQAAGFIVRAEYQNQLDKLVTVKIRIRSYGTVDEAKSEIAISDIEFAPFTKERAFVELKFEDPSYEDAVFKPQAYMNKSFIQSFGKPEFLQRYEDIKAETLAHLKISSKKTLNADSVNAMLGFLYEAHRENLDLSIVAINVYQRVAKSVALQNVTLEMTFDQLIALYIPGEPNSLGVNQYYKAYLPSQTVSEFKTPTSIAHHLKRAREAAASIGREGFWITPAHAKELDTSLPGLKAYFEMIDEIIQMRDPAKKLNRGKWGTALNKVKTEIEETINQIFMSETQPTHTP